MINHSFVDNFANKWTRIDKRTARKLFEEGKRLLMIPCKLNPASPWSCYAYPTNKWCDSFDDMADMYASINCNNETGRYLSFYVTNGPAISIRAPRFSSGGMGYVTADTIEVHINGYRLKNSEWYPILSQLVDKINTGHSGMIDNKTIHAILDPVALSLVGRVAW